MSVRHALHTALRRNHAAPIMTYCVAMSLHEGMLFASDSRTNAGVDNVSTFSKMTVFEAFDGAHQRCIVAVNAGNLATTQGVISQLRRKALVDDTHILERGIDVRRR